MDSILTLGFWNGGNAQAKDLLKKFVGDKYDIVDNIDNIDKIKIIVVCSFLTVDMVNFIVTMQKKGIKIIGFVTEPVENTCELFWLLYTNNIFSSIFGSVPHNPEKGMYKYPLYMMYFDYTDKSIFNKANEHAKTCDIKSKKDGIMITRHDRGGARGEIFGKLQKIGKFDSASDFMRTISSEEVDRIGNVEYIKQYKFNLCPNAYKPVQLKGYIVEKILNSCLGSAIPIYYGELDDIDKKIFNENRIIHYEAGDNNSINMACEKVKHLLNDYDALKDFYTMNVFMDTAWETCMWVDNELFSMF